MASPQPGPSLELPPDIQSTIRGYHIYRYIWPNPFVNEELRCELEPDNPRDKDAIAIKKNGDIVGHVPREHKISFGRYLRQPGVRLTATVTGQPVEIIGLEVPCIYRFAAVRTSESRKRDEPDADLTGNLKKRKSEPIGGDADADESNGGVAIGNGANDNNGVGDGVIDQEMETDADVDVPDELVDVDPSVKEIYLNALKEGKEKQTSIRVMVVGHHGVGKTSLTRNLLELSLSKVKSTNGIDVHQCKSSKEGDWREKMTKDDVEHIQRLVSVASSSLTSSNQDSSEADINQSNEYLNVNPTTSSSNTSTSYVNASYEETAHSYKAARSHVKENEMGNSEESTVSGNDLSASGSQTGQRSSKSEASREIKSKQDLKKFASAFDINENSTKNKLINIWDFGGQFVFYATHQLFHTRRAVYLLVLDLSKDFDDHVKDEEFPEGPNTKDVKYFYKFWLNSIHTYVGTLDGEPPVILIGTKKDKLKREGEDVRVKTNKYFDNVRELFSDNTVVLKHIHEEDFAIDNLSMDESVKKELRTCIETVAKKQKSWNREIPARWIPLENSLKMKSESHVTFADVVQIDEQNDIPLKEHEVIKSFLIYHHQMGNFVYFKEEGLSHFVVLNPQWIIDGFKCIITSGRFCRVRPSLRELWKKLVTKAVLKRELIDELLKEKGDFSTHKEELLLCMNKLGIIAQGSSYDIEKEEKQELDFYIVPSLLKNCESTNTGTDIEEFQASHRGTFTSLVFKLENDCVSSTLYHQITAAAMGTWPVIKYNGKLLLFEDIGIYELDIAHAAVIAKTDTTIEIRVLNMCGKSVNIGNSDKLRRFVEMVLKHQLKRYNTEKEVQYKMYVLCNHGGTRGNEIKDIDTLKKSRHETVPCPDQIADHQLNVTDVLNQWYQEGNVNALSIKYGHILKEEITEKQARGIARSICRGWDQLRTSLKISKATIDQIKKDHKQLVRSQIYHMLITWKQQEDEKATLEVLLQAIEETLDRSDVNWDGIKNMLDRFPY